ncbi:MAG: nitrate- and nitrite sensing domain-containing protein [Actinomycetes bacterium]
MLRDAGVRTKLLAVLAIPTVLLVVATMLLVAAQVSGARSAGEVDAVTDVAIDVNRVVHAVQDERSTTLVHLQDTTGTSRAAMLESRRAVDDAVDGLRSTVASTTISGRSRVVEAITRSAAAHDELLTARRSIDQERFYATEADVFYTNVIQTDLQLPGIVASSGTPELAARLRAHEALSSAIEYAAHERDLVQVAHLRGGIYEVDFAQASALVAQQRQALQTFQQVAPAAAFARLDGALADADNFAIDQSRRHLVDLLEAGEPDPAAAAAWQDATDTRILPMTSTESIVVLDLAQAAAQQQSAEERQAYLLGAAALLGLVLTVALAVGLAARISRPLRRLTDAADEIGAELPHMVERMQTPGEGPGVELTPIDVESRDEIGRLAEAFNTVNEVTVRVAGEQAALRAGIAEMFVNVARRNQLLLGRQLAQIDKMESREEDPDTLEDLFTVDHLATRMRRNAESLLVLAGIDSTRRLRGSLPLSDVIRTAVGEIEAFQRVDLSMTEDLDVSGHLALTAAHLLAELLENATHFSNPDTRVVVAATVTGNGVDLTVSDYGLGMSPHEYAEANSLIADPPLAEIAVSQRLGFLVVGRLAARLGADVTLRPGRTAGTVVTVALPHTMFPRMEAPVVAAPEEAPVEVPDDLEVTDDLEGGDDLAAEPAVEEASRPRRPRRWLRRRGGAETTTEDEVGVATEVEADAATEPEAGSDDEPQDLPETAPEVEPEPRPDDVTETVPDLEPVDAESHEQPGPAPAYEPGFAFAPAVDVLPGRPMTSRLLPPASPPARVQPAPQSVAGTPGEKTPVPIASVPSRPADPGPTDDGPLVRDEVSARLHSDALSELRGLYEPKYAGGEGAAEPVVEALVRRSPKPVAPDDDAPSTADVNGTPRRTRNATEVRGMLSGFRAGVERGRSVPAGGPAGTAEPERRTD